jgi:hypothetical protein
MPDIFFSRTSLPASFVLRLALGAALLGALACDLLRQTLCAHILILVALTLVIARIILEGRKGPDLPRRAK